MGDDSNPFSAWVDTTLARGVAEVAITPQPTAAPPKKRTKRDDDDGSRDDDDDDDDDEPRAVERKTAKGMRSLRRRLTPAQAALARVDDAVNKMVDDHAHNAEAERLGRDAYEDMDAGEEKRVADYFKEHGMADTWRLVSSPVDRAYRMDLARVVLAKLGPVSEYLLIHRRTPDMDAGLAGEAVARAAKALAGAVGAFQKTGDVAWARSIPRRIADAQARLAKVPPEPADDSDRAAYVQAYARLADDNAISALADLVDWAKGLARAYADIDDAIDDTLLEDPDDDAVKDAMDAIRDSADGLAPATSTARGGDSTGGGSAPLPPPGDEEEDGDRGRERRRARSGGGGGGRSSKRKDDDREPARVPRRAEPLWPVWSPSASSTTGGGRGAEPPPPLEFAEIAARVAAHVVGTTAAVFGPYVAAAATDARAVRALWAAQRAPALEPPGGAGPDRALEARVLARMREEVENFDLSRTLRLIAYNMDTDLGGKAGEPALVMHEWVSRHARAAALGGEFEREADDQVARLEAAAAGGGALEVPVVASAIGAHDWVRESVAAHFAAQAARAAGADEFEADADAMDEDAEGDAIARGLAAGMRRARNTDLVPEMWGEAQDALFFASDVDKDLTRAAIAADDAARAAAAEAAAETLAAARAAREVRLTDADLGDPLAILRTVAHIHARVADDHPHTFADFADLRAAARRTAARRLRGAELADSLDRIAAHTATAGADAAAWRAVLDAVVNDIDALRLRAALAAQPALAAPERSFLTWGGETPPHPPSGMAL